jgi:hypothetical protein
MVFSERHHFDNSVRFLHEPGDRISDESTPHTLPARVLSYHEPANVIDPERPTENQTPKEPCALLSVYN